MNRVITLVKVRPKASHKQQNLSFNVLSHLIEIIVSCIFFNILYCKDIAFSTTKQKFLLSPLYMGTHINCYL